MKLRTPIRASESIGPHIMFRGPWSAEDRAFLRKAVSVKHTTPPQFATDCTWTFIVLEKERRPVYVATRTTPALKTFCARTLTDLLTQMRRRPN